MSGDLSWSEVLLRTSLQGIINATEVRAYLIGDDVDRHWLTYYGERYGVESEEAASFEVLLDEFKTELRGYAVYDEAMLDSANLAMAWGALHGALPVPRELAPRLRDLGLEKIEDFTGRWMNRYDAYRWGLAELFPRCNQQLLGGACVDIPHWPSNEVWCRDYFVAHKIFTVDLSANVRDREDRALLGEVFAATTNPGCILGWRCMRCNEHEYVGLAAKHGVSVLSATGVRNLSVHAAIPRRAEPFQQDHAKPEDAGPVENKIYVSFMATDGDSLNSMVRGQSGRLYDPEHGDFPYSFGVLPAAWDLMPGVLQYTYEQRKPNDYFVTPSSGVTYTYPYLQKDPEAYLRMSRWYMEQCDQRVAYMINWDDDQWWQEIELPEILPMLREALPECIAFLRGMGESPFERQHMGGGAPSFFTGEGIHAKSEVYAEFKAFIGANPIRPLFIFCMSNHTVPLGKIKAAFDQFPECEIVRIDHFAYLAQRAAREGRIPSDDFYPDKAGLNRLLIAESRAAWPDLREKIRDHAERCALSPEAYRAQVTGPVLETVVRRSSTRTEDIVAHEAAWDSFQLAKVALGCAGINVNRKAKGVDDFETAYGDVEGAGILRELWEVWMTWEARSLSYREATGYAVRLGRLASAIDARLQ